MGHKIGNVIRQKARRIQFVLSLTKQSVSEGLIEKGGLDHVDARFNDSGN